MEGLGNGLAALLVAAVLGLATSSEDGGLLDLCGEHTVVKRSYLPAETCKKHHVKGALQAQVNCKPRPEIVSLPWPNNTHLEHMTPTHITVSRCSGGCHLLKQSCIAVESRIKEVPVLLSNCGISQGKCDKKCATVKIEEHLKCNCQCVIKEKDCRPEQEYARELCACKCRDQEAARMCQESGRVWNPSTCACRCPVSSLQQCSTGLVYDHNNTCTCIPVMNNEVSEQRIERSSKNFFLNWEIIAMGVLLCILFLLMILTITLARRLHTLKQRLKTSQVLLPSSLTKGLYIPCSDPCTDLSLSSKANFKNIILPNEVTYCDRQTDSSVCCDRQTDSSLCCDSLSSGSTDRQAGNFGSNRSCTSGERAGQVCNRSQTSLSGSLRAPLTDLTSRLVHYGSLEGTLSGQQAAGRRKSSDSKVQIVYRQGDKTMRLNCQLPQSEESLRITENPVQSLNV